MIIFLLSVIAICEVIGIVRQVLAIRYIVKNVAKLIPVIETLSKSFGIGVPDENIKPFQN